MMPMQIFV